MPETIEIPAEVVAAFTEQYAATKKLGKTDAEIIASIRYLTVAMRAAGQPLQSATAAGGASAVWPAPHEIGSGGGLGRIAKWP